MNELNIIFHNPYNETITSTRHKLRHFCSMAVSYKNQMSQLQPHHNTRTSRENISRCKLQNENVVEVETETREKNEKMSH